MADYTKRQKADTIAIGSFIVTKNAAKEPVPCQVTNVTTTTGSTRGSKPTLKFDALDIFTDEAFEHEVKGGYVDRPIVNLNTYPIIDIGDGTTRKHLILRTDTGFVRPPLSMPPKDSLPPRHSLPPQHAFNCLTKTTTTACGGDCTPDFVAWCRARVRDKRAVFAIVKSAMGKEQVCGFMEQRYGPRDPPPAYD